MMITEYKDYDFNKLDFIFNFNSAGIWCDFQKDREILINFFKENTIYSSFKEEDNKAIFYYGNKKVVIYKKDELLDCSDFVLKVGYGDYNNDFECYGDCSIVVKDMKMLFKQLLK